MLTHALLTYRNTSYELHGLSPAQVLLPGNLAMRSLLTWLLSNLFALAKHHAVWEEFWVRASREHWELALAQTQWVKQKGKWDKSGVI